MTFAPPFTLADRVGRGDLLDALTLEEVDTDLFRATFVAPDVMALYGGQVAAQALLAAGRTVPEGVLPHSLHGYFLRAGDSEHPTLLRVRRDRDGRSYSARRVEAVQRGEVIFSMAASFAREDPRSQGAPQRQDGDAPSVEPPEETEEIGLPRLLSFEGRAGTQPRPTAWPTRFWARTTADLPDPADDPLLHAAVLTYLSDISSGLSPWGEDGWLPGASLDHAVWFHHPPRADDWVLTDLRPEVTAHGRGWYTGTMYDAAGRALASLTQECLVRRRRD